MRYKFIQVLKKYFSMNNKSNHGFLFETKTNANDELEINGYASVFQVKDSYNDIVVKGAFADDVNAHKKNNHIKLLWQHDHLTPIGKINYLVEDNYGLMMSALITNKTNAGMDAISLIKQGVINGLSIGFNIAESYKDQSGSRVITKLKLWEISLVTFPANGDSFITNFTKSNNTNVSDVVFAAYLSLKSLNNR